MEDRKRRFDDQNDVTPKIAEVLKKLGTGSTLFDGVHIFTPHADVPDDSALRLVFLGLDKPYSKQDGTAATAEAQEYVRQHGTKPRYRGNRLLFVAADQGSLSRLRDCVRTALAWQSIVDDIESNRLNIDRLQQKQAEKELESADAVVPKAARECFKWLLCPAMKAPTDREVLIEAYPIATSGSSFSAELDRVCKDNELVIEKWSPIHLRTELQKLYWKADRAAVGAMAVWGDLEKYLYLPRLKNRGVFEAAMQQGAKTQDFFGTALAENGGRYEGFKLGDGFVQLDDTLLLIEPAAARAYQAALASQETKAKTSELTPGPVAGAGSGTGAGGEVAVGAGGSAGAGGSTAAQPGRFFASVQVNASTAKMDLVTLAEEIIGELVRDPNATVTVVVEVAAEFPKGPAANLKRAVSENVANLKTLKFKSSGWE